MMAVPVARTAPSRKAVSMKARVSSGRSLSASMIACHRSQFGDMHASITKAFKRYNLFGFTGTPIFAANAGTGTDKRSL